MPHSVQVLLVDANPSDAAAMQEKLAGAKSVSFAVHTTATLPETFAILRERHFDVLLIDLQSPGSKGIATLKRIRKRLHRETPMLGLSSSDDETDSLEMVRAGAQDYLVKDRLNSSALERILVHCIERQRDKARTQMQYLVSRVLTDCENQAEARARVVQILCEYLEYSFGHTWVFDDWSAELIWGECYRAPREKYEKFEDLNRAIRFERGHGFPGRVWDQGKTLWIEDVSEDRDFGRAQAALDEGLRSVLPCSRLRWGPRFLG